MSRAVSGAGNLLINGAFLPGLWQRMAEAEGKAVACPVASHTFAADRWHLRYAAPRGGEVSQACGDEVPVGAAAETCLEIRGHDGLTESVFVGQILEADDAPCYRHKLRFAAWCRVENPLLRECPVRLVVGHAAVRDVFDSSVESLARSEAVLVPVDVWTRLDFTFDATAARRMGLCVELEWPAAFLNDHRARVCLTAASLWPADLPEPAPRPNAVETLLARRFFQRHNAQSVNAIGRALVCNPHELHFQFTFPEMRAFPSVSLPQDNDDLTVFSPDGVPQSGFTYDVPYSARGSAIIRATKWDHGLGDGFMAFRGYRGAILLEAEL